MIILKKLLLLFKNFEINGSRDEQLNLFLKRILGHLTPRCYDQLINKHDLIPGFSEPWRKNLTGGSDDHSSLTITRIHTQVPGAASLEDFFTGLHHREARVIGRAFNPHTLAHNIYSIAYQFYANKLGLQDKSRYNNFLKFLDSALTNSQGPKKSIFSQVSFSIFKKKASSGKTPSSRFSFLDLVKDEITKFIQEDPQLKKFFRNFRRGTKVDDKEWYDFIKQLSNKLIMKFNDRLLEGLSGAHFIDLFQSLTVLAIIYLMLLPYFAAFNSFSQDRHFSQEIFCRFMQDAAGPDTDGQIRAFYRYLL